MSTSITRFVLLTIALLLLGGLGIPAVVADAQEVPLISICHHPPGNPENEETIEIHPDDWLAHASHGGDEMGPCAEDEAKLVVHKIICNEEADLPNWNDPEDWPDGAPDIVENTAQRFVNATFPDCWFHEGWEFEWAPRRTRNPGDDHYGYGGGAWRTFGPTEGTGRTDEDGMAMTFVPTDLDRGVVLVREVLQEGFIPFTYGPSGRSNENDTTAEFYCHNDGNNYDNLDAVRGVEEGGTYYCIAFNVEEEDSCEIDEELFANPGFEQPEVGRWDIFFTGEPLLEWVAGGFGIEIQNNVAGSPHGGDQHTELDTTAPTEIWQEIETEPGATYRVAAYYSPRPGRDLEDNRFEFRLDGSPLGSSVARDGSRLRDTSWTLEERLFVAEGETAAVGFAEVGTATGLGAYLDDVSVQCVEEANECDVEGYKYDEFGDPLPGWEIGVYGEFYEHRGDDGLYEWRSFTDVTDEEGYYCIDLPEPHDHGDQDAPQSIGRNYQVGEYLQEGWSPLWVEVNGNGTSTRFQTDSFFDVYVEIESVYDGQRVDFYNREFEYAPYCGDGEVNQEWEQCDLGYYGEEEGDIGPRRCNAQCQYADSEICTDLVLARVEIPEENIVNEGAGDMTSDIYVGSEENVIPSGAWFPVYWNGSYVVDPKMASYQDVPGMPIRRVEGQVRGRLYGSHEQPRVGAETAAPAGGKEHVDGRVEFWNAVATGVQNVAAANKSEKPFDGERSFAGNQDELRHIDDHVAFWMTVTTGNDGFRALYSEPPVCDECDVEGFKYDEYGSPLSGWTIGLAEELRLPTILAPEDSEDGPLPAPSPYIVLDRAETDDEGYYCLNADDGGQTAISGPGILPPTRVPGHVVFEELQNGWNPFDVTVDGTSTPFIADSFFDVFVEVFLPESERSLRVDFYNTEEGDSECLIEGYKYDEFGVPLPGWEIGLSGYVYYPEARTAVGGDDIIDTAITNENGWYCIPEYRGDGPPEGSDYTVGEFLQDGWSPDRVLVDGGAQRFQVDSFFDVFVDISLPPVGESLRVDFYNAYDSPDSGGGSTPPSEDTGGNERDRGGSRVDGGGSSGGGGQVLGATASCGLYLDNFILSTMENDVEDVLELQVFLNSQGIEVPLNGIFDEATQTGVSEYQVQNASVILDPWEAVFGPGAQTPSGEVYITTWWWINNFLCPGIVPFPELIPLGDPRAPETPQDLGLGDTEIFTDGFESGDTSAWN